MSVLDHKKTSTKRSALVLTVFISLVASLLSVAPASAAPTTGYLDPSFNSNGSGGFNAGFNARVDAMAVQPDGKIIVAGIFTTYNGSPANGIARLNADGTLDSTFVTGAGFVHAASTFPKDITVDANGNIYVVGGMTSYNGVSVPRAVKLSSTGALDTTFNTNFSNLDAAGAGTLGWLESVLITDDGGILIGGGFRRLPIENPIVSATTRPAALLKVNSLGVLDQTFLANIGLGFDAQSPNSYVFDMIKRPNGDVLVVGGFQRINTTVITSNNIALINQNGTNQTSQAPNNAPYASFSTIAGRGFGGEVDSIAQDSSGKIYAMGRFTSYDSLSPNANRIVGINADGSRNTSFNVGTGFNSGQVDMAIDAESNVIVSGGASVYNGTTVTSGVFRIRPNGTLDTSLAVGLNISQSTVRSVIPLPNGNMYIGGSFSSYSSIPVGRIALLSTAPSLSPATQTVTGTVGQSFTTSPLTFSGVSGTSTYSVSPSLPSGLSLNTSTGVISGTVNSALASTVYTITGTNGSTSAVATVNISVAVPTPSGGNGSNELAKTGQANSLFGAVLAASLLVAGFYLLRNRRTP